MTNKIQNVQRLASSSNGDRNYAPSIEEALEDLNKNQLIPQPSGGSFTPVPGAEYSNIKKGIHEKYILDKEQRFGSSRANYKFNTELLRSGYTSFSGADTTVSILFKKGNPIILGEMQTITYSLYTPTAPVYSLGSNNPSGFVRGPRTIAGTIIFTIFDRHPIISAFHYAYDKYMDVDCLDKEYLGDELPPFDLQVTFLNEYGQSAGLTLHDVRLTSEGQVMSIEDMITENTMQYVAANITLMQPDFVLEPY